MKQTETQSNPTSQLLKQRRTIRQYTDKPISDELLHEIIEEAMYAPTTGNMQLYSVVATRDKEMKKKLAPTHFNQPQVENCGVFLTVCADCNRFVKWCEQRNANVGFDNLQSMVAAVSDALIFAQQLCTAAESHGLGTCYLGTVAYNAPQIAEILELPQRVVPVAAISVGFPANDGQEVGRLPIEAILHSEKYTDYSPEDIDRYYQEKEAREDSKMFVKENAKENLAQVFTDVRYTKEANETFSKILLDFLNRQFPYS